jgi:hypothetical protein
MMSESTKQSVERLLMGLNICFALLGLGVGMSFCRFHLGSVQFFAFFPINIIVSIYRYGIICQTVLLLSTLLFPALVAYDFINAFYINPDPQSGLVLFIGYAYSVLMIPFWFLSVYLSRPRVT